MPPFLSSVVTKSAVLKAPVMCSVVLLTAPASFSTSVLALNVSVAATKPVRSMVSPIVKPLIGMVPSLPAPAAVLPVTSHCAPPSNCSEPKLVNAVPRLVSVPVLASEASSSTPSPVTVPRNVAPGSTMSRLVPAMPPPNTTAVPLAEFALIVPALVRVDPSSTETAVAPPMIVPALTIVPRALPRNRIAVPLVDRMLPPA